MKKVCFIGGGNMASAMLAGLRKENPALECHVVEPVVEARERMTALGVNAHALVGRDAVSGADAIVLAVKPQNLQQVCAELAPCLTGELIISIAAGTRVGTIARWLQGAQPQVYTRIVRCMPNTPALIGKGISGYFADATVSAADVQTAEVLLRSTGDVLRVDSEAMIDAVTAVSGSGPAYVFHWIESMQLAAEQLGFNAADARTLVLATLKGATALAEASSESPAVLRERVTSKGGTTAAALTVINERAVQAALVDAVKAARDRGEALGALLDQA